MSLLERLEVPAARSFASISPTERPLDAASRAMPTPVIPPPTTRTSISSRSSLSTASALADGLSAPRSHAGPHVDVERFLPARSLPCACSGFQARGNPVDDIAPPGLAVEEPDRLPGQRRDTARCRVRIGRDLE